MKHKIFCEVCRVSFIHRGELKAGETVICTVCGARLEVLELKPEVKARRYPQEPEQEIRERVDNFARLRGYVFDAEKEAIIAGLMDKYKKFGDFYCPCRFDNIPENICPCLETRMNQVKKEGQCL
ncbi:MAG TPA: ferredoxin-thioredoxin reductase catalytic domain-containing protein [Bacillota bacterium]|nr:ferredoxin-thioredoxin reductase catalytic domain-containing protein [Bacillota bacterium]